MKRCFSLLIICIIAVVLSGCSSINDNSSENPNGSISTDTTTPGSNSNLESDNTSTPTTKDAYTIMDLHRILTSGSQLIMSTAEYEMYTWETIYKYSDEKAVDDTFLFLLSKTDDKGTLNSCYEAVVEIGAYLSENDADEDLQSIIANCVSSYTNLNNTVVLENGSYKSFKDKYNTYVVEMADSYDTLIDYLVSIGKLSN